jgi:hypothetical protein
MGSFNGRDQFEPPTEAGSVAEAVGYLAAHLETLVDEQGWDMPASLWEVRGVDLPDDVTDFLTAGSSDSIAAGFGLRVHSFLEGHPREALVGCSVTDPDVLGVVLVTEGWAYSRDREGSAQPLPPSGYEDSRELRLVYLLLRDGSEALVRRVRGSKTEPDDVLIQAPTDGDAHMDGEVVWAVRRVLGLPSGASRFAHPPSWRELWWRIHMAPMLLLLSISEDPEMQERLVAALLASSIDADESGERQLRYMVSEWRNRGLEAARDGDKTMEEAAGRWVKELSWFDADMAAVRLTARLPTLEMTARELQLMALTGHLGVDLVTRLASAAGLRPPTSDWGVAPARHQSCLCGSGRTWGHCHRPRGVA